MATFFLYKLRSTQRVHGHDLTSLLNQDAMGSTCLCDAAYASGAWLRSLPAGVDVAWLQYDRSGDVLQISRKVDWPTSKAAAPGMVSWRVPLQSQMFERLEAEFSVLQREHQSRVSAVLQRDDRDESNQRKAFWADRSKCDGQIEQLAGTLQNQVLQAWRFLLLPLPKDATLRESLQQEYEAWCLSEAEIASFRARVVHSSSYAWMLFLLYWAADNMEHVDLVVILSALLRVITITSSELNRLATSLKSHRARLGATVGKGAELLQLLLFVDSEVAQFPLEACPCLRSVEVTRGIAANVALDSFLSMRWQAARSPARPNAQSSAGAFFALDPLKDCEMFKPVICSTKVSWKP
jgi:hypothetical protein